MLRLHRCKIKTNWGVGLRVSNLVLIFAPPETLKKSFSFIVSRFLEVLGPSAGPRGGRGMGLVMEVGGLYVYMYSATYKNNIGNMNTSGKKTS